MFNPKTVPVPKIRKRCGGPYGYFRHMATTAEKKANQPDPDSPRVRGARCGKNLPSGWDDFGRCVQRTWKVQRRTRKAWARK